MEIEIHIRKGSENRKFIEIVDFVSNALKTMPVEGRIKERLLPLLSKDKSNLGGAWQDGDELRNLFGKNSEHRFDIYNWKKKVAIEIEESEVKYLWKDFIKLSIGARRGIVDYAILICPRYYKGKTLKTPVTFYSMAIGISKFMADLLWMKNLAIIGYDKYKVG
jgi:hypothetical protein